jgi:hypothetical protein
MVAGTFYGCVRSFSTARHPRASLWNTNTITVCEGVCNVYGVLCGGMLSYVSDPYGAGEYHLGLQGPSMGV